MCVAVVAEFVVLGSAPAHVVSTVSSASQNTSIPAHPLGLGRVQVLESHAPFERDLGGVRAEVDCGADLLLEARLLEYRDIVVAQGDRSGESGDSGCS